MIRRALLLFLCWALVSGAFAGKASAKRDAVAEVITKGAVCRGRLWLVASGRPSKEASGTLLSLDLVNESRTIHFASGVLDMERAGNDLWVLRKPAPSGNDVVLSAWRNEAFQDVARFSAPEDDQPVALVRIGDATAVLSLRAIRVLSPATGKWDLVPLRGELRLGVQMAITSPESGGSLYVGINRGEWGGGLQRVDLRTGVVTNVERRDKKGLCEGPLNSDCDPVTGVIPDPQNKDCVLATVGLVHLSISNGRILRVCGDTVSVIFQKALAKQPPHYGETEAFYGLVPAADGGYWAITWRALYQFGANGTEEREYTLPKVKPISGVYLSRDLPGVIVLRSGVNWQVSTSGYTPLVVPMESTPSDGGMTK